MTGSPRSLLLNLAQGMSWGKTDGPAPQPAGSLFPCHGTLRSFLFWPGLLRKQRWGIAKVALSILLVFHSFLVCPKMSRGKSDPVAPSLFPYYRLRSFLIWPVCLSRKEGWGFRRGRSFPVADPSFLPNLAKRSLRKERWETTRLLFPYYRRSSFLPILSLEYILRKERWVYQRGRSCLVCVSRYLKERAMGTTSVA